MVCGVAGVFCRFENFKFLKENFRGLAGAGDLVKKVLLCFFVLVV